MARKQFRNTPFVRVSNRAVSNLLRLGVRLGPFALLTVPGRTTGTPRTTPVAIGRRDGHEFIASPSGVGDWVKNLRAAHGRATIRRGRRVEAVRAVELDHQETARFLQAQLRSGSRAAARFIAPYCDVEPDSPLAAFEREAPHHPVFRLDRLGSVTAA